MIRPGLFIRLSICAPIVLALLALCGGHPHADAMAHNPLEVTATNPSEVPVSGAITVDTTWHNDNVYLVVGHVLVRPGVTLTIEPGTQIKFESDKGLVIEGTLVADGAPDQPIVFTASAPPDYANCEPGMPCPGEWAVTYGARSGGILFTPDSEPAQYDAAGNYLSGSVIRYAVIEYSKGGINVWKAGPFLDHNTIQKNRDAAIVVSEAAIQFTISSNRIMHNEGYALNLLRGDSLVRQNLIAYNDGIAIRTSSLLSVEGHRILSNTVAYNRSTQVAGNCNSGNYSERSTICLLDEGVSPPTLRGNNLFGNSATYDIVMGGLPGEEIGDVDGHGNYWGTSDQAAIAARIYDFNENISVGVFTFVPFLANPDPTAPVLLDITKTVAPQGQVATGDTLTYTLAINAAPGTRLRLFDPLTGTTFAHFIERPSAAITYTARAITGTLTVTPTDQITVSFVAQVVTPTIPGATAEVTNRACVVPVGKGFDACFWSNRVTTVALRASNQAPYVPADPIPADAATGVSLAPLLSWRGGDPDGGAVTYTVALGITSPPPVVATNQVFTSYQPSALITATTYYWHITATDGLSTTAGAIWKFTTAYPAGSALIDPNTGGEVSAENGAVALQFPGGAVADTTLVTVTTATTTTLPIEGFQFAGRAFKIAATGEEGAPVTSFSKPFTLTVHYDDADWQHAGITNESLLNVYWWNGSEWRGLLPCPGCVHDQTGNRLVFTLDHLTDFAVMARNQTQIFLSMILNSK